MRIARKIARIAEWIDERNCEPHPCYGMRNSYFLWMMASFCFTIGICALIFVHDNGLAPPLLAFSGGSIPFGAGLAFYLNSRRATSAIIGTLLVFAAAIWYHFGLWKPLSTILACLAGVCCMLALFEGPAGASHHNDEPQPTPAQRADSSTRNCRKAVA